MNANSVANLAEQYINQHRNTPSAVLEYCEELLVKHATQSLSKCTASGVCGKVWKTGDTVYHCRTCGMDPSCAICHECFEASDHTGHDCAHTTAAVCHPANAPHAAMLTLSLPRPFLRRLDVLFGRWLLRLWGRRGLASCGLL